MVSLSDTNERINYLRVTAKYVRSTNTYAPTVTQCHERNERIC